MPGRWTIHTGRIEDVIPGLDGMFDAVLCDPPYGIGFMERAWDAGVPGPDAWRIVSERLWDGAHLLAFGAPRTEHRLVCAIEDAGMVPREKLMWLFGTGFPKNHNISKALDRRAEAGTPLVRRWSGHGTALAPAWEPVVLARKPLDGTIAENVEAHGVGGINIDGTRVPRGGEHFRSAGVRPADHFDGDARTAEGAGMFAAGAPLIPTNHPGGRWPSNLVLSHTHACRPTGERKVPGHRGYPHGPGGASMHYSDSESRGEDVRPGPWAGHADADGNETVETWDCAPDCPVRLLDEQSGVLRTSARKGGVYRVMGYHGAEPSPMPPLEANEGGASRYFPRFAPDEVLRFRYQAKAWPAEKDAGLEDFRPTNVNDGRDTSMDTAYQRGDSLRRNTHPSPKPLALTRWLATLLLPPPRADGGLRRILVPFAGSGSEMIGALLAGWDEIVGVEMEPEYVAIAEARLSYWARLIMGVAPENRDPRKLLATARASSPQQRSLFDAS